MVTLLLDGEPAALDGPPVTLGDLLSSADGHYARTGRIVTAVRIDGVEEPAFREPAFVDRPAAGVSIVTIESGTKNDLVRECLAEAGNALGHLAVAAAQAAVKLRAGEIRGANADLAAVTEGIATVVTITGAASLGLGIDLGTLESPHGSLADVTRATAHAIEQILALQAHGDWPAVADHLEHRLALDLRQWAEVCRALDLDRSAPAPVSRLQSPDGARG